MPSPHTCANYCLRPPSPNAPAVGLRVLVLAGTDPGVGLRDAQGCPALPALEPVALVTLADELRPRGHRDHQSLPCRRGVLKVLSGDDPRTGTALAVRASLEVGEPVAGAALDGLDDLALDRLVARTTVFGRVTPEQQACIVTSLRRQGHYVAMSATPPVALCIKRHCG